MTNKSIVLLKILLKYSRTNLSRFLHVHNLFLPIHVLLIQILKYNFITKTTNNSLNSYKLCNTEIEIERRKFTTNCRQEFKIKLGIDPKWKIINYRIYFKTKTFCWLKCKLVSSKMFHIGILINWDNNRILNISNRKYVF